MTSTFFSGPVVLAIRLRQLGDVLATLGTLRAIKEAAPRRHVVFVVDGHYHELLRSVPYIDLLLPQPPRIHGLKGMVEYSRYVDQLRGLEAECALDFHCNVRSAIITYLSGAPVRIGFDVRGRKLLYTEVEPRAAFENGKIIPQNSHASAMALAARIDRAPLRGTSQGTIPVGEQETFAGREALLRCGVDGDALDQGDVIGLNPGNPYPAKAWPDAAFATLARRLARRGKQVVIVWGPGERERAMRIAGETGADGFVGPECALREMPGLLRNLSLLVTIDSGLKHLAVATDVPTVTLFGPTSPDEWHMGGALDRVVTADLSCSPCRLLVCPFDVPCMTRIYPEDVLEAISHITSVTSAARLSAANTGAVS